jgi:hypothetical protein
VTEPTPPDGDGDSGGESPDEQGEQAANRGDVARRKTPPTPSTREPFGLSALERTQFFGELLLALLPDTVYLATVYGWYRLLDWIVDGFGAVEGVEYWTLVLLEGLLTIVPGLLVVWYVIVDSIGAGVRIWNERKWNR